MSYIRSGSNPECLYIFGSKSGLEIYGGDARKGENYFHLIPQETWNGLCRQFVEFYDDAIFKGASITEEKVGDHFKHILRYEDWSIEMWEVTWYYIVDRYRDEQRKEDAKIINRIRWKLQFQWYRWRYRLKRR